MRSYNVLSHIYLYDAYFVFAVEIFKEFKKAR